MSSRCAGVWYESRRVGILREADDARLRFRYDDHWLERGFPISLSLPFAEGERDAHDFFAGLLPEAGTRTRIARERHVSEDDDIGLLFEIGRDCAGALSILPDDETPLDDASPQPRVLEALELDRLILSRGHFIPDGARARRFSLAGAQDKVPVIVHGETLSLPDHLHPSNAILKFETVRWVCTAEYFGNALARRIGLDVPSTSYRVHDGTPYLLVQRYDRREQDGRVRRLHQEDFTQALGYPSARKYESDGGPELPAIAAILRRHVQAPVRDVERLRDWQLFNYLIGNYDGHAKNLSLLYDPDGAVPSLAPFYDLVCIEFMNRIGVSAYERALAFSVSGIFEPERIRRRDWESWAKAMSLPPSRVLSRLEHLALTLPDAARAERAAFADEYGDNPVYGYLEEAVADRCRWMLNNVVKSSAKR